MNKKERYKKLFRKVRRARRMGEPHEEWLVEMDELDEILGKEIKSWKKGVHRR